jgi:hypothetical protein
MCCLKYEQDAYEDLLRNTPKNESFVDTPDGRGSVIEVDLLRQRVKVRLEEQTETAVWHKNSDIAVLRSGKAKKNDPPIPADLAPISGCGKRKKEVREEENSRILDSIRLRYSEETIADETVPEEKPATEERRDNRKNRRNRRQKAVQNAVEEAPVQEAPAQEPAQPQQPKRNNYRHRHFRHKKPGNKPSGE